MGLVRNGLILVTAGALLTGCVNRGTYDELADAQRTTMERNEAMKADLSNKENEIRVLREQLTRSESLSSELRGTVNRLRDQLSKAEKSLLAFGERLGSAQIAALDPETDRALARLANENPNLIRYDSARGMLRFASDLTFDSGQDVVKGEAKQSLGALANVLKSASATAYEVHVVGHTDAQPISSGTAQRHPTNTHLSCHRAIAVRRELISMGVAADRLLAAGWGETRPAVPNNANGNTPANRRVEIFLTRPSAGSAGGDTPSGSANPENTAPPSRPIDVTK